MTDISKEILKLCENNLTVSPLPPYLVIPVELQFFLKIENQFFK